MNADIGKNIICVYNNVNNTNIPLYEFFYFDIYQISLPTYQKDSNIIFLLTYQNMSPINKTIRFHFLKRLSKYTFALQTDES